MAMAKLEGWIDGNPEVTVDITLRFTVEEPLIAYADFKTKHQDIVTWIISVEILKEALAGGNAGTLDIKAALHPRKNDEFVLRLSVPEVTTYVSMKAALVQKFVEKLTKESVDIEAFILADCERTLEEILSVS
jgi:hypothetical protein